MARTADKPVQTLYRGTNADLLVDVARLYIPDGVLVADVTWGHGVFWQKTDTTRFTLVGSDVAPAVISAAAAAPDQLALITVQAPSFLVANCTALPYRDQRLDVVVLDPPYLHYPGPHLAHDFYNNVATTKGMSHKRILRELYCPAILEACRVLKPGGLLLVKGKDEIERGKQCWSHEELTVAAARCGFTKIDMFIYEAVRTLTLLRWAGHAPQKYARKNHSYLLCFRLTDPPMRLTRGRPRKGRDGATLHGERGAVYLRSRLMRDHPAIYARYMAGELPSVHAAAKVAGLVKGRSRPTGRRSRSGADRKGANDGTQL
jgi:hypothetical protein